MTYYMPESRDTNVVYALIFAITFLWMFFTFLPGYMKAKRAQESKELALAEEQREQDRHEVSQQREQILNEYLKGNPKEALAMLGKSSASRQRPSKGSRSVQGGQKAKSTKGSNSTNSNSSRKQSVSKQPRELKGELVEHGRARYQHKPDERFSYYVTIKTNNGLTTVWGKELKPAIDIATADIGDTITLERGEKRNVTVETNVRDEQGKVIGREPIQTYRQEWVCTRINP